MHRIIGLCILGERLFSPQAGMQRSTLRRPCCPESSLCHGPRVDSCHIRSLWRQRPYKPHHRGRRLNTPLSSPYSCYVLPQFRGTGSQFKAACLGNGVAMVLDWARKSLLQTRHVQYRRPMWQFPGDLPSSSSPTFFPSKAFPREGAR